MPFLDRTDASLYYETQGDQGPWICLINGHTRSSRDFRLLSKTYQQAGFRCLSFDNRGSGQTQASAPFHMDDLLADVVALWDHCGIDRCHLLGISMGGMISQILAAQAPQRLLSLILISTAASEEHLGSLDFEPWGESLEAIEARLRRYVAPRFYEANRLLLKAMSKQIFEAIQRDDFVAKADAQHKLLKGLDNTRLLPLIKAPTLILHGTDDAVIKAEAAEQLRAGIPHAELILIENAGHLLLAECSKRLSEEVLAFCRRHAEDV